MTQDEYGQVEEYVILEVVEDLIEGLSPENETLRGKKDDVLGVVRSWMRCVETEID